MSPSVCHSQKPRRERAERRRTANSRSCPSVYSILGGNDWRGPHAAIRLFSVVAFAARGARRRLPGHRGARTPAGAGLGPRRPERSGDVERETREAARRTARAAGGGTHHRHQRAPPVGRGGSVGRVARAGGRRLAVVVSARACGGALRALRATVPRRARRCCCAARARVHARAGAATLP